IGGKAAGSVGAGGVGMYKGMRDGKRSGNVKPVPPRDPNKGTTQDKQQFSTNTVNNPNPSKGNNTPVNGSSTIPTKPSSDCVSTSTEHHVSPKSIHACNATNSSPRKPSTTPHQSTPVVNARRQVHLHPRRKHPLP